MTRLLIGTTNRGKQGEFRRLLASLGVHLETPDSLGLDLVVEEPHDTYAANALAKAEAYAAASGMVTVADDSGIEAAALDWGPGVRSARWGGGNNATRLLEALAAADDRRARMVCVVAIALPGQPIETAETFTGVVEGHVAHELRGQGGFGYDPVFVVEGGRTTAELPEQEKDRISHRGRAVAAALPRLRSLLSAL